MEIILASNSPRRKELLTKAGYLFKVVPSTVEEVVDPSLMPKDNVASLAKQKCLDVAAKYPHALIIGADTIVVFNNQIYGKPQSEADAYRMLKTLENQTHEVMTGVCVSYQGKVINEVAVSKVTFKQMTEKDILDYIETQEPNDKAGAYAIQGIGKKYIEKFEGDYDNIVGLPMQLIDSIISKLS